VSANQSVSWAGLPRKMTVAWLRWRSVDSTKFYGLV